VRWGRLYRGNVPADLDKNDIAYLSRLRIKLVCDYRSERERDERPSTTFGPNPPETLSLPVDSEGMDPGALREQIRTGGIAALGVEDMMTAAYRSFVTDHTADWANLFRRIEDPASLPTLVHCTAGKDRTGFASALVLLALGVPEETVYEDYLLTNRYRESFSRFVLRWVPLYSLFRTDPEDLLPLLEARREYLETSLATITELHGSLDAYLEGPLGVTPARRAALRKNLLR
jgi:protein-tyrosine phosphatase